MDPRLAGLDAPPTPQDVAQETSIYEMLTSKYGSAAIAMLGVFIVLFWMKPPIVMQDVSQNQYRREYAINWVVVLVWLAVAGVIVLLADPALRIAFPTGNHM